ncbi:DUF4280 domain-containing protein [Siculibacillus lacustris]|uniref:DUF4280 domain-containing protein n=1 Tax=Siculibacillus lacustris TaxID=1549641 RepID=A0A4Q9VRE3_9HYPH|nr:DUF4280 domain-containing protein [Siculibacillus lacustris]TBW38449.1 DUF4280 domain-containing protein [Siculibacillus lacustris]
MPVPEVTHGAMLMCSFGAAPSSLVVLPVNRVLVEGPPGANINDHVPMVNIMPFGVCMTPSNPAVAAATTAALGVLTPMPCIPVTPSPWTPGGVTVNLGPVPVLDQPSVCMCTWGGVITIAFAATTHTLVP